MIKVSPSAAQQINDLRQKDQSAQGKEYLRVRVAQGGCSGMSYKLDFEAEVGPSDKVFEQHGAKIVIDSESYLYLAGTELDYEGGLNGKGFTFSNPNASRTCGCGSSFGI
jgi:iron-sulfur cluster assembly protein